MCLVWIGFLGSANIDGRSSGDTILIGSRSRINYTPYAALPFPVTAITKGHIGSGIPS